jgi:oligopeptide/dipeptide ABC transporter ATP-binding protein
VTARPLLDVESLVVEVYRDRDWVTAVRDVSFSINEGERLALVGESGSGKSLTAMALGGLLSRGARVRSGRIQFREIDLARARAKDVQQLLGREIGFVFQDPSSALDPTMPIGKQIAESLDAHGVGSRRTRRRETADLLARVGIPDAHRRLDDYPHEFSGGMCQRAVIASALISQPALLIADEPTSALDVTVQAQILELLNELSAELGLAVLFITHDLAVARAVADRVGVMYAGRLLEHGPAETMLLHPDHPYSRALLALAPRLNSGGALPQPIAGTPIAPWLAGDCCPFAPRCRFTLPQCEISRFVLLPLIEREAHASACIVPEQSRLPRPVPVEAQR